MALNPDKFTEKPLLTPLTSGFVYRPMTQEEHEQVAAENGLLAQMDADAKSRQAEVSEHVHVVLKGAL